MAGWHELMATEFVDAARNTFASNYESTVIEPHELLELAEQWFSSNEELASKAGVRLILNKRVKVKDKVIPSLPVLGAHPGQPASHRRGPGSLL